MSMREAFTVDAKTIKGNRWVAAFLDANNSGSYKIPRNASDTTFTIDTDGFAFLMSQLTHLETEIYQVPYAEITFEKHIPLMAGVPEHAQDFTYRSYDAVTMGKFLSVSAKNLPTVQTQAKKSVVPIQYGGNSFEYALHELVTAAATGVNLDSVLGQEAFRGAQEHLQQVAYFGDPEHNMAGLLNNPNVTKTSAPKGFDAMSGQELYQLIYSNMYHITKVSKQRHKPNKILVPPSLWERLNDVFMSAISEITVLEMLRKKHPEVEIDVLYQLEASELALNGVQNNNKDRILIYEQNPRNLVRVNNIPWRMREPQRVGLSISVPCEYKGSGTEYRLPLCARYVDAA